MTLHDWIQQLQAELGTSVEMDIRLLLDVARDASHAIQRPEAPLTTFLVGYAAAARGGSAADVAAAAATAARVAARHAGQPG